MTSLFRALAFALVFFLFGTSSPASAQYQSYYYRGPAFNVPHCQLSYPTPPPTCVSGSVHDLVVLQMPAGYTGSIGSGQLVVFSYTADGIGTLVGTGSSTNTTGTSFSFVNGQMTAWHASAISDPTPTPPYTS